MNFATWPALLVVDVEGNGTNPPDLVETAALPIRDARPDKNTAGWWLTRPNRPVTPFATRVHGLTEEAASPLMPGGHGALLKQALAHVGHLS